MYTISSSLEATVAVNASVVPRAESVVITPLVVCIHSRYHGHNLFYSNGLVVGPTNMKNGQLI